MQWNLWSHASDMDQAEDEDPGTSHVSCTLQECNAEWPPLDVVQGIDPAWDQDLGMAGRRDPDALPPSNAFQWVMHWTHGWASGVTRGNVLYALKAGLLSGEQFSFVAGRSSR